MKTISILSILITIVLSANMSAQTFKSDQQRYSRVRQARINTEEIRDSLFEKTDIDYPPYKVFLRVFKHERVLELWAQQSNSHAFKMIKLYPFTAYCGDLGPKRQEGDLQIPEGFYHINLFNPASSYHLSMQINYPNKSDLIKTTNPDHPGGLIFIHGNRVTIGCIPLGDQAIEELYIICVDSKSSGQQKIPVHIFPFRFEDSKNHELYKKYTQKNSALKLFWDELMLGYDRFQQTFHLPDIQITSDGNYVIRDPH